MGDIFQDLAESVNLPYVSDLQHNVTYQDFVSFAKNVSEESYTINSWNAVFEYVFDKRYKFTNIDEIRSLMI